MIALSGPMTNTERTVSGRPATQYAVTISVPAIDRSTQTHRCRRCWCDRAFRIVPILQRTPRAAIRHARTTTASRPAVHTFTIGIGDNGIIDRVNALRALRMMVQATAVDNVRKAACVCTPLCLRSMRDRRRRHRLPTRPLRRCACAENALWKGCARDTAARKCTF